MSKRILVPLLVLGLGLTGCEEDFGPDIDVGVGTVSELVPSDAPAEATVGGAVELEVTAQTATGDPAAGVTVTWSVEQGDGSVSSATSTTDETGTAATTWTLGTASGTQSVTATAEGVDPVTFTLTSVAGPAAEVTVSPANIDLTGVGDTVHLSATAVDQFGNPTEATFTFSSTDEAVATVSAEGVVTAQSSGSAEIVVTAGEAEGRAAVSVEQVALRHEDAIAASARFGCVLDVNGAASCWGVNWGGQLGNGTDVDVEFEPVAVSGGHTFTEITAGADFVCALTVGNEVYCWGYNRLGGVGNGTVDQGVYSTPQLVVGGHSFATVDANWYHACAVTTDGEAYCWGSNLDGNLGDGTTDPSGTPVAVTGGETFESVATGYFHTCGLKGDGSVRCWGYNGDGAFGDGTTTSSTSPVPAAGGMEFVSLGADWSHTCGIAADGQGYCWGHNAGGRLGDGTDAQRLSPTLISGGNDWSSLRPSNGYTCGVATNGTGYCWGFNNWGVFGNGTFTGSLTPTAVNAPVSLTAGLDAGFRNVCAIGTDGRLFCWGQGDAAGQSVLALTPQFVSGVQAAEVAVTGAHSCVLDPSGAAHCWGSNYDGQLGNGETGFKTTPVAAASGMTFTSVAAGFDHTCGLESTGDLHCWGGDWAGQLGDGAVGGNSTSPVLVTGGHTFSAVDGGAHHTCALAGGDAYCWGLNDNGQVGGTDLSSQGAPVAAATGMGLTQVTAGEWHTCALDGGGNAYCWGRGSDGQLGAAATGDCNGTACETSPVAVSGGLTFESLSAGGWHTCGLTTANEAYCWGHNGSGRLGDGTQTASTTPVAVAGGHTFGWISAHAYHTCAGTTAGDMYCWGSNFDGKFGDGTLDDSLVPVLAASGLTGVTAAAGSRGHTCAIDGNSDVHCWGFENLGQLGNGKIAYVPTPTSVGSLTLPSSGGSILASGTGWTGLLSLRTGGTASAPSCSSGAAECGPDAAEAGSTEAADIRERQ